MVSMAFLDSAPLFVEQCAVLEAVPLHINDRVLGYMPWEKIPAEMMVLLSGLEVIYEKDSKSAEDDDFFSERRAKEDKYLSRIKIALRHFDQKSTIETFLVQSGLVAMFPFVAGRHVSHSAANTKSSALDSREYFSFMSNLNQCLVLSHQIRDDLLALNSHKYIAHQIALLYQCLNQLGSPLSEFMKQIESRFEEIKRVTERGSSPMLTAEEKDWLVHLVEEIIASVASLPVGLLDRIRTQLTVINNPQSVFPRNVRF